MGAGHKTIRLSDIARECGVSAATVGKVLNPSAGSSVRVSEETSRRVLEVARRLNYHPNLQASSLRCGSSRLIGVLIDSASWEGLARMLVEIENQASLHDYQLMISGEHDSVERYKAGYQRLRQYGADGIICVSHDYHFCGDDLYDFLQPDSGRVVLVGKPRTGRFWHVDIDYGACIHKSFEYFVDHGRRRIAFVCFAGDFVDLVAFRDAFDICRDGCGKDIFAARAEIDISMNREELSSMVRRVIKEKILPWKCDAVIFHTDFMAGVAIKELLARGIRVPEDIAVIGHGNDLFDDLMTPGLASMDDGLAMQGRAAFDLIRMQCAAGHSEAQEPQVIDVKPGFVWRPSAG